MYRLCIRLPVVNTTGYSEIFEAAVHVNLSN